MLKSGCVGEAEAPSSEAAEATLSPRGDDDRNPPPPARGLYDCDPPLPPPPDILLPEETPPLVTPFAARRNRCGSFVTSNVSLTPVAASKQRNWFPYDPVATFDPPPLGAHWNLSKIRSLSYKSQSFDRKC